MIAPQERQEQCNKPNFTLNYMRVYESLSEVQRQVLKEAWENQGGYRATPWWQYVRDNTTIELALQQTAPSTSGLAVRKKQKEMTDEGEILFYYTFITICLSDVQRRVLTEAWESQGGLRVTPWEQFVKDNIKIKVEFQQGQPQP